jgi:D-serine deaminase-like pyridoxal phosphate-dependent protein
MDKSISSAYFTKLNQSLRSQERAIPFLLIDLDRLDHNIAVVQQQLKTGADLRLVVKSLPSPDLLHYVMERTGCRKLMVFHEPFLSDLAQHLDESVDILLGKPMPVRTVRYFYQHFAKNPDTNFDPYRQIQWLADSPKRLQEYALLAAEARQKIRINLEIDVGLHRGGFATSADLRAALQILTQQQNSLALSGLMGYDPQVVKLPRWLSSPAKALAQANQTYREFIRIIEEEFPTLWRDDLTFNGAGSPTFGLHQNSDSPLNDVAIGSAFVKPTTFDIPTLVDFQPACWIATPVLKKMQGTKLPGIGQIPHWLKTVFLFLGESYFIYGGYWKADYCYPPDIRINPLFGASTNQSMLNASGQYPLEVDDFVFLRPWQSEFVFLQFGRILTVRNGEINGEWGIFST